MGVMPLWEVGSDGVALVNFPLRQGGGGWCSGLFITKFPFVKD